jgi:Formate--tetrahydrofolate ligase
MLKRLWSFANASLLVRGQAVGDAPQSGDSPSRTARSAARILQDVILRKMGIDVPGDGSSVPPDFVIAQRAILKNIASVAQGLGLHEDDYDLYGKHKAKVQMAMP